VEDKDNAGSPPAGLDSTGGLSGSGNVSVVVAPRTVTVSVDRSVLTAGILSLGVAGALILFVYLSFQHPAQASLLAPYLGAAGPIGMLIINLLKCPHCKEESKNGS